MMRKKITIGVVVSLVIAFCTYNAFAYYIKAYIPTTKSLSYYTHSSLTTSERSAAMGAAGTWSAVSNGISFTRNGNSSGEWVLGDSRSDIASAPFSDFYLSGMPVGAVAVNISATPYSNYSAFDILINSECDWGNGNSGSYYDRQGTFTHEFGHAAGLDDNGSIPGNTSPDLVSPELYQTMWPYTIDPLGNNITYYQRTLESDDINGVRTVASRIR